jgi:putative transposase
MTDVNHQVTKTLVEKYPKDTLFVLEDLTNVSFNQDDLSKSLRNSNRSWSFFQFEQFLLYKAEQRHSGLVKVAAQYTSQRCPACGLVNKTNRHHETHSYYCDNCGYQSNDDRIGAMNIQELGKQFVSGVEKPKFEILKTHE